MRVAPVALVLLPTAFASAQDIIYYKFDAGEGRRIINYAPPNKVAWREGVVSQATLPTADIWTSGKWNGALRGAPSWSSSGHARVDTGWHGAYKGSLTIAFFFKMRSLIPRGNAARLFGSGRGCLSGYLQGGQFKVSAIANCQSGGTAFSRDVITPARTRWVHLAYVLDDAARVQRFYVDGVAEKPIAAPSQRYSSGSIPTFVVGKSINVADIDEFRVSLRAVSAAEIKAWATKQPSAAATYGVACHEKGRSVLLDSAGGLPKIGNTGYRLEVFGPWRSSYVLLLGTNRSRLGTTPLPFDIGGFFPKLNGCLWEAAGNVAALAGSLDARGAAAVLLPIPRLSNLVGERVYGQALMRNPVSGATMLTNAHSTVVGN